jgi:hypothetical protein
METTEEIWLTDISRINGKNKTFYVKALYNIYERKRKKSRKKCHKNKNKNLCNILRDFLTFYTYIFMGTMRIYQNICISSSVSSFTVARMPVS